MRAPLINPSNMSLLPTPSSNNNMSNIVKNSLPFTPFSTIPTSNTFTHTNTNQNSSISNSLNTTVVTNNDIHNSSINNNNNNMAVMQTVLIIPSPNNPSKIPHRESTETFPVFMVDPNPPVVDTQLPLLDCYGNFSDDSFLENLAFFTRK